MLSAPRSLQNAMLGNSFKKKAFNVIKSSAGDEATSRRTTRLPCGACPESHEILRYTQNDRRRRARNDSLSW